ncbi:hypothetical protein KCU98_g5424, partial [Aureobasidium melanogenum]
MATSVHNQPPELVDLPTEILVEIFGHLPDKDLSTVRLVCKELCDAATPRFATVNFTERTHDVSPYSINALIKITEHPCFGNYVKDLTFCSWSVDRTVTVDDPLSFPITLDGRVSTKHLACCLERVFKNIKYRSGSVAISIYDEPRQRTPARSPAVYDVFPTAETLEQTVYAARRARCPIRCLKIDLFTTHGSSMRADLDRTMHRILESNPTPLSIELGGDETSWQLSYDSESLCLKVKRIYFKTHWNDHYGLPVEASYNWLLTRKVTELVIARTKDFEVASFQPFFTPHLKRLELSEMYVFTDWIGNFAHNLWSKHIQTISELPGLQHCSLIRLRYGFHLSWDYGIDYLKLRGHGEYPCNANFFDLAFRDGRDSIDIDGSDVCEKLKQLACYVAAAEAKKLQDIINDGRVNDLVVGIIDEVEDRSRDEEPVQS